MKRVPDDLAMKLLEASNEIPVGTGFDVSIDEMARLAAVPRATLYYYFSGRGDLVQFFLSNLLERAGTAIQDAAAIDGSVVERLEAALTALLRAFAAYPRMCVELPEAVKESHEYASVMGAIQRGVLAPLQELLKEGHTTGELVVEDVDLAAMALLGGLHITAMIQIVMTGQLDAERLARALVPQLMRGLLPR